MIFLSHMEISLKSIFELGNSCKTPLTFLLGAGQGQTPLQMPGSDAQAQGRTDIGRGGMTPQWDLLEEHGSWRNPGGKQRIHCFQDNRIQ